MALIKDYLKYFFKSREGEIDPGVEEILSAPRCVYRLHIPLKTDTGSIELVPFIRCIYNNFMGPGLGPLYFKEKISESDLVIEAFENTIKNAILSLPFGGAAGAFLVNENKLSWGEKERLVRGMVFANFSNLGPTTDIYTPIKAEDKRVMGWINDTYTIVKGEPFWPVGLSGESFYLEKFNSSEFEHLSLKALLEKIKELAKIEELNFILASHSEEAFLLANILETEFNGRLLAIKTKEDFFIKNPTNETGFYEQLLLKGENLLDLPQEKYLNPLELGELGAQLIILPTASNYDRNFYTKLKAKVVLEVEKTSFDFSLDTYFSRADMLYIPNFLFNIWQNAFAGLEILNCRNFCYITNNQLLINRYLSLLEKPISYLKDKREIKVREILFEKAARTLENIIFQRGIIP